MNQIIKRLFFIALIFSALCFDVLAQELLSTTRVSQTSSGTGQNGSIGRSVISANGKFVIFPSDADNLVSGDSNGNIDIFMRNLTTGATQRININNQGLGGNGDSSNPAVSPVGANGFFVVAYESEASNLGWNKDNFPDTNGFRDIYFTIPSASNITARISIGVGGVDPDDNSDNPSVTKLVHPNRLLVVYSSLATNLVANDTNNRRDIFLATMTSPADDGGFDPGADIVTTRINQAAIAGQETDENSSNPSISGNGRYVVYESDATNLVSGVSPSTRQIYLFDRDSNTTTLVSRSSSGTPGDGTSREPAINYRGTYIAYLTTSNNIVDDGQTVTSGKLQVVRYNVETGVSDRVNAAADGTPGNGNAASGLTTVVSPNGRFVLFSDRADNLVSDDTNGSPDVFLKDFGTGEIVRISKSTGGTEANDGSSFGTIAQSSYNSSTGLASYVSTADNLISTDTEGFDDAFLTTLTIPPLPLTKDTTIEVPPDVASTNSTSLSVTMQEFDGVELAPSPLTLPLIGGGSLGPPKVEYEVKSYRETDNQLKKELQKRFTKKRQISVKNLRAGATYVVSYRNRIIRKNKLTGKFKVVSKTNFSPEERITIGE